MTPMEHMMAAAHKECERNYASECEAHEKTKSELRVLKGSSSGTIRLQRVTIAALRRDKARMRSEWSSIEAEHWSSVMLVKEWESRTGLNMSDVLEGTYGKPWGILSHKVPS